MDKDVGLLTAGCHSLESSDDRSYSVLRKSVVHKHLSPQRKLKSVCRNEQLINYWDRLFDAFWSHQRTNEPSRLTEQIGTLMHICAITRHVGEAAGTDRHNDVIYTVQSDRSSVKIYERNGQMQNHVEAFLYRFTILHCHNTTSNPFDHDVTESEKIQSLSKRLLPLACVVLTV